MDVRNKQVGFGNVFVRFTAPQLAKLPEARATMVNRLFTEGIEYRNYYTDVHKGSKQGDGFKILATINQETGEMAANYQHDNPRMEQIALRKLKHLFRGVNAVIQHVQPETAEKDWTDLHSDVAIPSVVRRSSLIRGLHDAGLMVDA